MNTVGKSQKDIAAALSQVNALLREAKSLNYDILHLPIAANLNPGDIYDAYLATGRTPVLENILEPSHCGPLAAVFLHRFPQAQAASWKSYIQQTFDAEYLSGFNDGFQRMVPDTLSAIEWSPNYLRGLYDGVMANAAVF